MLHFDNKQTKKRWMVNTTQIIGGMNLGTVSSKTQILPQGLPKYQWTFVNGDFLHNGPQFNSPIYLKY